ncbi:class I SAM-dependent methyltransferase [Brachyspira intermedia]|uniref:class I SAM-dependent methyltransferase n=1 Tax=Brachyspira intermedia TaxID=84377 RepID=UPI0030071C78
MKCNFCNGNMEFIYKLDNYDIVQCNNCYTSKVYNMPTDEELKKYYSGFTFQCNENIKNILTKNYFYDWYKSFNLPENAKMLDIGGGGGGFSYAFEYFNIGKSTYLDLDDKACEFAKNIMGIKNILNMDISNIDIKDKYDFIYCRHVIEHLKEPEKLINYACQLISKNGVFILHFPNGLSLERFGYKNIINSKVERLMKSNNFSYMKAYKYLLSNKFCHGLDPINHLWSITSKAISIYLDKLGYKIKYALLDDKIYSPYFNYSSNKEKIRAKLINMSLTKIYGGAHLIFIISNR